MAKRGPKLKSRVKEAEKTSQAIEKGLIKAQGKKKIEQSLEEHIGKAIDRINPIDAAIMGGLAYIGYERIGGLAGALIGPIAFRLATSANEIASSAGLGTLAAFGVVSAIGSEAIIEGAEKLASALDHFASVMKAPAGDVPHREEWAKAQLYWLMHGKFMYYCDWLKENYPDEKAGYCTGAPYHEVLKETWTIRLDTWKVYEVYLGPEFQGYLARCTTIGSTRYGKTFTDNTIDGLKVKVYDDYGEIVEDIEFNPTWKVDDSTRHLVCNKPGFRLMRVKGGEIFGLYVSGYSYLCVYDTKVDEWLAKGWEFSDGYVV